MLKKIILGIVVGAIVLTTSAGFLYAYQKESGIRQTCSQESKLVSGNNADCTNQNCENIGDCTNCQNLQNGQNNQNSQGFRSRQENNENCTGTCPNNGDGNNYNYRNQNNNCTEFSIQNMSRARLKGNQQG